jgi:uncharacterized protein (TIGR02145 family)
MVMLFAVKISCAAFITFVKSMKASVFLRYFVAVTFGLIMATSCASEEDGVQKPSDPEDVTTEQRRPDKIVVIQLKDGSEVSGFLVKDDPSKVILETRNLGKVEYQKQMILQMSTKRFGVVKDARDGNEYRWIEMSGLAWMGENLRFEHRQSWPPGNKQELVEEYGLLYSWDAAKSTCPEGWRLPTDEEWQRLEAGLGMEPFQLQERGYRGSKEADDIKPVNGHLFSLNYAGARYGNRDFRSIGKGAFYWSSTEYLAKFAWARSIFSDRSQIARNYFNRDLGFSVRCVCELNQLP